MSDEYTKILLDKPDSQIRLTVHEFRDVEYFSIREYYLDFDEEWRPSNKGVTIPLDIPFTQNLFDGLVGLLSHAESKDILEEHFKESLDKMYEL